MIYTFHCIEGSAEWLDDNWCVLLHLLVGVGGAPCVSLTRSLGRLQPTPEMPFPSLFDTSPTM